MNVLFRCCKEIGAFGLFEFQTDIFPVYLILKKMIQVYEELNFIVLKYNGKDGLNP